MSLDALNQADFSMEVVVVDNDVAESARPVVDSWNLRKRAQISYLVEPVQNIALTRNRAIKRALGTWIAFIDDDEVATKQWLKAYWQIVRSLPGDGYFG